MAAIGLLLIGLGGLTAWSGLDRVIVFDVLRSIIGAQPKPRTAEGANNQTGTAQTTAFVSGTPASSPAGSSSDQGFI